MMIKSYRILIFSENPDNLMPFYRDVLGLQLETKLDIPKDYGYMFLLPDGHRLWMGRHSEVKGKNKDTYRHIFNLYVDSVTEWYEKIKDREDVTIISTPEKVPLYSDDNKTYVSTFLDPEGNCLQFMGGR